MWSGSDLPHRPSVNNAPNGSGEGRGGGIRGNAPYRAANPYAVSDRYLCPASSRVLGNSGRFGESG
ncbi:hypothetical protein QFZ64_002296 [Streptomyces sp. B3I8]|nr:hypothetical protein [Streptomyces sp. B3I8]